MAKKKGKKGSGKGKKKSGNNSKNTTPIRKDRNPGFVRNPGGRPRKN